MANSLSPTVDASPQFARQFDIETIGGDQRQRLAEMLRSNALNMPQGQMVSGWYVAPSWTQNLAQTLNTAVGVMGGRMLDEERAQKTAEALKKFQGVEEEIPLNKAIQSNASQAEGQTPFAGQQTLSQRFAGNAQPSAEQTPMNPEMAPRQTRMRPLTQDEQDMALMNLSNVNPQIANTYGAILAARASREQKRQDAIELEKLRQEGRLDNLRMAAMLRPPAQEQLVAVMGNDGNAQLVPRSQAVGMTPFNAQTSGSGAGSPVARTRDANDAVNIVLKAAPLVRQSTNSGVGAAVDWTAGLFGASPKGADVAAQLKVLGGQLVSKMPKMSGPQSDKDVMLYKEMAGRLGDPTVPASQKEAALQTIYDINAKYAGLPEQTLSFEPSVMQGVGKSSSTSSKW